MPGLRRIRLILWAAVGVALFVLGALTVSLYARSGGTSQAALSAKAISPGAPLGGAFSLVDHKGAPVTEAIFRDRPAAVFFGFTHCPDVCPTTLMDMAAWIEALGPEADKMRLVFVTVDPERDTPEALTEYLSAFSDRIVGITGEPEKVHAMVRDYKVFSRKVPLADGGYTMDHTASVLLLDGHGSLVGTIARDEERDTAVAKLERLVAG
jgi:protein SCO1/2